MDLWIEIDGMGRVVDARRRDHPISPLIPIPAGDIDATPLLRAGPDEREFVVEMAIGGARTIRGRAQRFVSGFDHATFAIRILADAVPSFTEDIDCAPPARRQLTDIGCHHRREGGLVLVTGGNAAGKTWFSSALFAHWHRHWGGVGITLENPPELPLHGQWGGGRCYQRQVSERGMGEAVIEAMRQGMDRLLVGEIRTTEAIRESLNAAGSGALVIAPCHGGTIAEAIRRFILLSTGTSDRQLQAAPELYRNLLAGSLRAIVHLTPVPRDDGVVFSSTALFASPAVSALIRGDRVHHLGNELAAQHARMRMATAEADRMGEGR